MIRIIKQRELLLTASVFNFQQKSKWISSYWFYDMNRLEFNNDDLQMWIV